jgi:hypothetical protein
LWKGHAEARSGLLTSLIHVSRLHIHLRNYNTLCVIHYQGKRVGAAERHQPPARMDA